MARTAHSPTRPIHQRCRVFTQQATFRLAREFVTFGFQRFQEQAREETANAYPGGRIALPSHRRSDLIPDGYAAG